MQHWASTIGSIVGPKYLAIAEAIVRDVRSGVLKPGDRLPAQRALAAALKVDLSTVTRAYGEVQRQGLIDGDGRRGSVVRDAGATQQTAVVVEPQAAGMNTPPDPPGSPLAHAFRRTAEALLDQGLTAPLLQYQPGGGLPFARAAGVRLLAERGIPCAEDSVIVTAGGQNALHAVVSAQLQPGDAVAVGENIYSGFLAIARRYGLHLVPVRSDEHGLDPDALRQACRQHAVRAIYVVPANDNPATATMPLERRSLIAGIAEEFGPIVVEDNAYGLLATHPLTPIAALAPDRTWHIASVSKILAPGLRVAWLRAPSIEQAWRLAADVHETAVMAPPLNSAIVADWVQSGTFGELVGATREEAVRRMAICSRVLEPSSFRSQPDGYHLWLPLSAPVRAAEIVQSLRPHGLSISSSEAFSVDPATAPAGLRVSIGGTLPHDQLERGLRLLAALIRPSTAGRFSLV